MHLLLRQCPASSELRADRAAPGTTREHDVEDEEHVEVPEVTPCSLTSFALPALGADASPRLGRAAVKEAGVYLTQGHVFQRRLYLVCRGTCSEQIRVVLDIQTNTLEVAGRL